MASRKYVCDGCQGYQYAASAPYCRKCDTLMRDPRAERAVERPHDDYTPKAGVFFSVNPLQQDKFEKLMRAAFGSEAGIAGYAEV